MSNNVNTELIERAKELSEECTNSVLGGQLDYAMKHSDMEHLYTLVQAAERHLQFIEHVNDDDEERYGSESMQERADEIRQAMLEDGEVF